MIALLQRVTESNVVVGHREVARIGPGLLVLLGVERGDSEAIAADLAGRVVAYRIFSDQTGKMNLNVQQAGGAVLVVPQFTLAADTQRGLRPSFTPAADPETGARLFRHFADTVAGYGVPTGQGEFGADMAVHLVNSGPATFWLQIPPAAQ